MTATHLDWLHRLTGGHSGREIARNAGISTATLNRQINRGVITAENVILIARAYKASPVAALAQTGYITAEEAAGVPREALADLLSDWEVLASMAHRVNDDPTAWDIPLSAAFTKAATPDASVDDLADRRASTPDVAGDGEDQAYACTLPA